jgi:hypothetical protein
MSTRTPDKKIPFTEVAANLDKVLDQADPQRQAALVQLSRLRSVKLATQQREHARLSEKLGTSHPRVKALARKREANTAMLREVNLDLARAETPAINASDDAWLLHGRVMDRQRQGVPGLTITLVDAKGGWVRELGYACTDQRGYFRLSVDSLKATDKPPAGRGQTVKLRVSDRANKVLYTDMATLTPRPGQVDYREITLGEPPTDCRQPANGPSPPPCPEKPEKPEKPVKDERPRASRSTKKPARRKPKP